MTIWYSFRDYDLYTRNNFIGIQNFINLYSDPNFITSIENTFQYAIGTILPQLVLGLLLANVLNKSLLPGKNAFKLFFYLPYTFSMVSVSMLWLWIYDPTTGFLNQIFKMAGLIPQRWLFNPKLAMNSLVAMGIWKFTGYNMIIFLGGLKQIPDSLYEAADIDGVNSVRKFLHITFPLLQPTTFFLFVINTIQAFSVFEQVNIMTDGGPNNATTTIIHQIYNRGFFLFQMGYASAMGVVLLLFTLILTLLFFRFGNEGQDMM